MRRGNDKDNQRGNEMTSEKLKAKVTSLLVKWGNNEKDAEKMVADHFVSVSGYCHTARRIAECIRTIA